MQSTNIILRQPHDPGFSPHYGRLFPALQILLRDGALRRFLLPEDIDHPPAFAVVEQLKAGDPPHEGILIVLLAERFIGRENLSYVAELVHAPGHLAQDTREALLAEGLEPYVDLFRAEYLAFGDPAAKVAQWWDLDALEQLYDDFLDAHGPALRRWGAAAVQVPAGPEAFADHLRALTAWRRLPYLDPGLPTDLLPDDWSGTRAAETFFALHRTLAGPAHDFVTEQAAAARSG